MKILLFLAILFFQWVVRAGLSEKFTVKGYITTISKDTVTISMRGKDVVVPKKAVPQDQLRPGHFVSVTIERTP